MKKTFKPMFIVLLVLMLALVAGCASTKAYEGTGELLYEDSYEVAGYKFVYTCYDNHLTLNYIDFFSAAEIGQIADSIMNLYPVVSSYDVTAAGEVSFLLSAKPDQTVFAEIVGSFNEILYDYFY